MPPIIFLIVPKEFFAIKATIEAITAFEGRSALSAIAWVLSKILLALVRAFLIERNIVITAITIIREIIDQITTKTINTISRISIFSMQYTVFAIQAQTL